MIVLQPPLLCEGWVVILWVCLGTVQYWWISTGLVVVQLRAVFWPSVQYLSLFCVAFLNEYWTVVAFICFTVVKSFTSKYALLLLFFLRFSSISLHCSPIQFSLAFFMHLLMLSLQGVLKFWKPPLGVFHCTPMTSDHVKTTTKKKQNNDDKNCIHKHWFESCLVYQAVVLIVRQDNNYWKKK